MLAYILALIVGLGSITLYMAAFFFPEVHRKNDFIWSGVGFFYALVLWVCAGRITGGLLLGQMASVSLLGWFGWQTLTLRRKLTLPEEKTPISTEVEEKIERFSVPGFVQQLQKSITGLVRKKRPDKADISPTATSTEETTAPEETPESTAAEAPEEAVSESPEPEALEASPPDAPKPEMVEAAQPQPEEHEGSTTPPVEEIAPEAELAPPAEPIGEGDSHMRESSPKSPEVVDAVPIDNASDETEEKPENSTPQS